MQAIQKYPSDSCYKCPWCDTKRLLQWCYSETADGVETLAVCCDHCGVSGPYAREDEGAPYAEIKWNQFAKKWANKMTVEFDRGRVFGLRLSQKLLNQGLDPKTTLGIVNGVISFVEGDFNPVEGLEDAES